jgi:hypothetical protein
MSFRKRSFKSRRENPVNTNELGAETNPARPVRRAAPAPPLPRKQTCELLADRQRLNRRGKPASSPAWIAIWQGYCAPGGANLIWDIQNDALIAFGGNGIDDIPWHDAGGQNLVWIIQGDQLMHSGSLCSLSIGPFRKLHSPGRQLALRPDPLERGAPGNASCREVREVATGHLEDIRTKIKDLVKLERLLAKTIAQCSGRSVPDCPILDILDVQRSKQPRRTNRG